MFGLKEQLISMAFALFLIWNKQNHSSCWGGTAIVLDVYM